jgi:photoactive yellow protein
VTLSPDSTVSPEDPYLLAVLSDASDADIDRYDFGLIGFDRSETVVRYNADESRRSGLLPERVLGLQFFTEVAPCTNNYLVAERFRAETTLDVSLDYVFTLRMQPTPVRLRLLAHPEFDLRYLVVTDADEELS